MQGFDSCILFLIFAISGFQMTSNTWQENGPTCFGEFVGNTFHLWFWLSYSLVTLPAWSVKHPHIVLMLVVCRYDRLFQSFQIPIQIAFTLVKYSILAATLVLLEIQGLFIKNWKSTASGNNLLFLVKSLKTVSCLLFTKVLSTVEKKVWAAS